MLLHLIDRLIDRLIDWLTDGFCTLEFYHRPPGLFGWCRGDIDKILFSVGMEPQLVQLCVYFFHLLICFPAKVGCTWQFCHVFLFTRHKWSKCWELSQNQRQNRYLRQRCCQNFLWGLLQRPSIEIYRRYLATRSFCWGISDREPLTKSLRGDLLQKSCAEIVFTGLLQGFQQEMFDRDW